MTLYAIGDIHGHLDLLIEAHELVSEDRAREGTDAAPVIHLGDLVDRGPQSAQVITWLADAQRADPRIEVLMGNHDLAFLRFLGVDPAVDGAWREMEWYLGPGIGGRATLASYGIADDLLAHEALAIAKERVPEADRAYLGARPLMHQAGECVFVHAGIRPGRPLDQQVADDLIWIRDDFLLDRSDHGPLIVHGHTPVPAVEHHGNRLAIDTGAAFGGPLSVVAIEGRQAFVLSRRGRIRVERPE